ncbi:DUF6602 domain-containing protein [Virgibacillus proomii]|uniref:DUF6602 domain-containing protein n=1 Tax=Virgibacillus proomii TaxID=84407 RepID=UPI001C11CE65|nr:DUF6602 domain-containing protein [Virgibacillus proomii]MBU5266435.1 hypothetical protein [Virgibacillus proomii]
MEELNNLNEHYQRLAATISSQLQLETPNHHVTSGTSREFVWLDLFERLVPKKFKLARSVFIIDSYGQISAEVDIAIYDEQYTPYVFNYGEMQFIPIEAVAAAVQSKSRTMDRDTLNNVTAWAKTIYQLKPVLNACVRIQPDLLDTGKLNSPQAQTATRPILILCTLHSLKTDAKNDDISILPDIKRNFDFILHLDKEQQFQLIVDKEKTLAEWYKELNHYELKRYNAEYKKLKKLQKCVKENGKNRRLQDLEIMKLSNKEEDESGKQNPLLTFMFQFNQLLMIINNPMFFPHQAYVNMFNKAIQIKEEKERVKRMEDSKDDFLLAVYDITGIQDYIFASNRLKENIGASYIVGKMVETHFVDMLKDSVEKDREELLNTSWDKELNKVSIFKHDKVKAEVVYIGGGNALVIYRDWKLYNKVNRAFAKKVLKESASLTMVTEAIEFSLEDGRSYVTLYKQLMQKLSDTKAKVVRTNLNQTLPIFAQEPFKGNPITHHVDDMNVSTEQWLKRKAAGEDSSFKKYKWKFAKETEDLKRKKDEDSYIGVVHIDGNGMGEWIRSELEQIENDAHNLENTEKLITSIKKHRELSLQITNYFREAFDKTVEKVVNQSDKNSGKEQLPLRPLILDGDDFTFICQGDLAIPFTLKFLKQLKLQKNEYDIFACAGVAFVHSHFPFDLAYEIAEQCCQNAKKVYYKERDKGRENSYFDFYLVRGSYVQTMEEQRVNQTHLEKKIYNVAELEKLYHMMQCLNSGDEKVWPHSRLIALYEAYLQSEEEVELVTLEAASRGYEKIASADERLLFDALQLMDFGKEQEWKICRNMS